MNKTVAIRKRVYPTDNLHFPLNLLPSIRIATCITHAKPNTCLGPVVARAIHQPTLPLAPLKKQTDLHRSRRHHRRHHRSSLKSSGQRTIKALGPMMPYPQISHAHLHCTNPSLHYHCPKRQSDTSTCLDYDQPKQDIALYYASKRQTTVFHA